MFSKQVSKDLNVLLEYLWRDEKRNYEESNKPSNHIFNVMKRLKSFGKFSHNKKANFKKVNRHEN